MSSSASSHYRRPGVATRLTNRLVAGLTHAGLSVMGSRVLETTGRKSGLPRRTPVNLLIVEGNAYLVSPRGETEWVRNVRAASGSMSLILGRRKANYAATEVEGDERIPVLREYLRRWKFEVGVFFGGVGADSTDSELRAIADRHPVFVLRRCGDAAATTRN